MKTKAVRLYGKRDLRLEEFELPPIRDDEILAHVVCDSICMSSYKEAIQGSDHKRVPEGIEKNPVIIGHEFCGELVEVGAKWKSKFKEGQRFSIQPNLKYQGTMWAPGYSYPYIGGDATYVIIPNEVMEMNCLLSYNGEAFFYGSLAEPMSCIVAAFKASFHIEENYIHHMGPAKGGNMAILAGAGPMGLGFIDYVLHSQQKPDFLVITDIDDNRLHRARSIYSPPMAESLGIHLEYVNTGSLEDPVNHLLSLTQGAGYNDVFILAPVTSVVEQGDSILARDGCLNFFAGPTDTNFSAKINFYNVHYLSHHVVGTSGGNTDDMVESLDLMEKEVINPSPMITHIGGLNSVIETTLNLPKIPGGKKLIYTNIDLELTPLADFKEKGKSDPLFAALAEIISETDNLWSEKAEKYLLTHAKPI
ncbi:MAG: L-sorbose 1-phosphate reductase [Candidatus Atribacteria bacterium]|nr:L-sorbose 1-phosphate reductase [Candidatus Atribacteria bacterium]